MLVMASLIYAHMYIHDYIAYITKLILASAPAYHHLCSIIIYTIQNYSYINIQLNLNLHYYTYNTLAYIDTQLHILIVR